MIYLKLQLKEGTPGWFINGNPYIVIDISIDRDERKNIFLLYGIANKNFFEVDMNVINESYIKTNLFYVYYWTFKRWCKKKWL